MKRGETQHIGDGAYLHFDGFGFELRANHHEHPTDRVYIDGVCVRTLQRLLRETLERHIHVNSGDGTDACKQCGRDIRDDIHLRSAEVA